MAAVFLKGMAAKIPVAAAGAGVWAAATDPEMRQMIKNSGSKATMWLGQGLAAFSVFYYFKQKADEEDREVEVDMISKELRESKVAMEDLKIAMKKMLEDELKKMQEGVNRSIAAAILEAKSSSSGRSSAPSSDGTADIE